MDGHERLVDSAETAGLLAQIFPFDASAVKTLCATCGEMEPIGAEMIYADAPGMVLRCMHCQSVLIKIVHGDGRYWLDMRGVGCLQIVDPVPAEGA